MGGSLVPSPSYENREREREIGGAGYESSRWLPVRREAFDLLVCGITIIQFHCYARIHVYSNLNHYTFDVYPPVHIVRL